ncbi:MAG: ABC transporter substrate-binding protein [Candidatus Hydrogenedentes bacterium]|nr:ABC transporter substrate-binding protein [Candidatus Hydrogenedentota bacterium]
MMLAGLAAIALAGCGNAPPEKTESTATGETAAAPELLDIAVVPKGLAHQFWLTVKAGAEAAGAEFGAKIIWQGPSKETEVEKQINIIQDMINRNVDGLVMAACDENALIPMVEQALAKKIPVITIDSGVKSDKPLSFVATDNVAGAKAAADVLAGMIGSEGPVGLIPFVKGAATSNMREEGFEEGLKTYPNMTLVATLYCDSDVAKAMDAAQDMMTRNADLKGIFAANEAAAIGAAQAIKAAGKSGIVKLVAFDASKEEIDALQSGAIQALIVQNPFKMGYEGVKAAIDAIKGNPLEKRIDTGVTVVTMENFNEPEIQKLLFPI